VASPGKVVVRELPAASVNALRSIVNLYPFPDCKVPGTAAVTVLPLMVRDVRVTSLIDEEV
jgi:hypothetical protein